MILEVLYSCNEAYIEQAGISILSLCNENNSDFEEIRIHFVEDNISRKSKILLQKNIQDFNATLMFYSIEELFGTTLEVYGDSNHPVSIYSKIFCGKLPVKKRLLYIDCDCIITGSLKKLWLLDMEDTVIAGVLMPYSLKYKAYYHLEKCKNYICDGVVLFNLSLWRKWNYQEKCISYVKTFDGCPPMLSEGTLNYVCRDSILVLPPQYNIMGHLLLMSTEKIRSFYRCSYYEEIERQEAIKNPIIIHYIREFYERPWFSNSDHPRCDLYQAYKNESIWKQFRYSRGDFGRKHRRTRCIIAMLPAPVLKIISLLRESKYRRKDLQ